MATEAPLVYESSAHTRNLQVSSTLPSEVAQCLQNARFLHLATCTNLFPHVSLMNYTYLPSTPYSTSPIIIMTTNPSSKKTLNLISNPHVSLLVHDWVSHRPPTSTARRESAAGIRSGSPPAEAARSSLASLLLNLNTSALSSISATINGEARLVERGTEEEKFYRECHLDNNTFSEEDEPRAGGSGRHGGAGRSGFWESENQHDGGRGMYIEGEEVRVVVVRITDGRVSDWKGGVRDWTLAGAEGESRTSDGPERLVNGVSP